MTLLEDYRKGTKQGVHLDEPICSPAKRKRAANKRDEFFSSCDESPFFADKAPYLQHLANKEGIYIPIAHYTAIDDDAGEGKQLDSDCFSWSTRGMLDVNRIVEWLYKGMAKQYVESGATCLIYGSRGHCGKGMTVYDVIRGFDNGILLEKEYEIRTNERTYRHDFTSYPSYYKLGVKTWCGKGPPASLLRETRKYSIPEYALASSMEEVDANLVSGRTWSCGSSIGVSTKRDKNGVSKLRGSWAHAMHIVGKVWVDWVKEEYGQPLYIWDQSWGNWNKGAYPAWAKKLKIKLPQGFFLLTRDSTWKAVKAKQCITCSGIRGFPNLNLPDLGFKGRI